MTVRVLEFKLKQARNYITLEQMHVLLSKIQTAKIVTKIQNRVTGNFDEKQFAITTDLPKDLVKVYLALGLKARKRFC